MKAEHWRTDAVKLGCWRRLLRVPWTAWRSSQSILQEINPENSLEELMLKLKLKLHYVGQSCEELTHWKRPWYWERWKAGGGGGDRGWDGWMASLSRWIRIWGGSGSRWCQRNVACCRPWGCKESYMTEQLNWLTDCCNLYINNLNCDEAN